MQLNRTWPLTAGLVLVLAATGCGDQRPAGSGAAPGPTPPKVALGKLGEGPFAVPSRYQDRPSALTEGDLMALGLAVRGEERHLTQEQLAELRAATKGWPGSQ